MMLEQHKRNEAIYRILAAKTEFERDLFNACYKYVASPDPSVTLELVDKVLAIVDKHAEWYR